MKTLKLLLLLVVVSTLVSCTQYSEPEVGEERFYCEECRTELNPFDNHETAKVIDIKGEYVKYIKNDTLKSELLYTFEDNTYDIETGRLVTEADWIGIIFFILLVVMIVGIAVAD
jgi:hypothetical protein